MSIRLITEYSIWLALPCLMLAALFSYILYRRWKGFSDLEPWKLYCMASLRFLFVFFLSFFLLSPLVKIIRKFIEKPVILFAQDNTESVKINKDSLYYVNNYPEKIKEMLKKLSSEYEVKTFSFGDRIEQGLHFDYSGKETDYSGLFDELKKKYSNRHVGALIIATDGLYNKGVNPSKEAEALGFPVYSVALGDTGMQKDLILSGLTYNKIAFLGNQFPLRIQINAKQFRGKTTQLTVTHAGEKVFSKLIDIGQDDYHEVIDIEMEASATGMQRYTISLSTLDGELSLKNNVKDMMIEVIDSRQKILILVNSPHPDAGAIKNTLESNPNYEVDYYMIDKFNKNISDYNMVVLHQIPSKTNAATTLLSDLLKQGIPALFITGAQSNIPNINNMKMGYYVKQTQRSFEEVQALFNQSFSLFRMEEEIQEMATLAPPLIAPFGDYSTNASTDVLFFQKIRNIPTTKPLIFFSPDNGTGSAKMGFICGEGIWRWRLYDHLHHFHHDCFNGLINKIIQYLALKEKKDKFIVQCKKAFNENEPIRFDAELYNESFELINKHDISLEIVNSQQKKYAYVFNKTAHAYQLDAGMFPVGDYTYKATVKQEKITLTREGRFSVISLNVENENTMADHRLLYQLSQQSGGKMYYPDQCFSIIKDIEDNKNIVPVSYTEKDFLDLIHLRWIFFILLTLASAEWFMRRFFGSY